MAQSNGKVNSFWETKKLKVNEIAVSPTFQNKGVGSRALKKLGAWAKKKKYSSILLSANQKSAAFGFYKRNGFHKTAFVTMEKKL